MILRRSIIQLQHGGVACLLMLLVTATVPTALFAEQRTPSEWLKFAVDRLCSEQPIPGLLAQQELQDAWLLSENETKRNGQVVRIEQRFALSTGNELRVVRFQPGALLRRFTAELHEVEDDKQKPLLQAMADGACRIRSGRRIIRDRNSPAIKLKQLDGDLRTIRCSETLQAPWPTGRDPGGPRVALIDSGLAYDLPIYRNNLARGPNGKPLGYDFWDMDAWPYDGDTSRGAFLPIRHGSAVASVLVREAPLAALIPFRYPRPDMSRLADAIQLAAKAGARILAMPLGSRKPEQRTAIAKSLKVQPSILAIVSAGNDGHDIDQERL